MPRTQRTPTLDALSAVERAGILTTLLRAHPELTREAETMAVKQLAEEDKAGIAVPEQWLADNCPEWAS